jgi:nucleoside-diphosphate-sugar epimerase
MFGWFDRKHLGWLARFMRRSPIFPVPGDGRYLRQPLYAGDFCNIIATCVERRISGLSYNISGQERVDYIDLIRLVQEESGARTKILRLPYLAFWILLRAYMMLDTNPPFTTQQLAALVLPEVFEVIDWPSIFDVRATPLREAMHETFNNSEFSHIALDF